jgi:hypothetical protein
MPGFKLPPTSPQGGHSEWEHPLMKRTLLRTCLKSFFVL